MRRDRADALAKGLQPTVAVLAVLGPFDHVEDGQDRLVGVGGLAEESADGRVVELLLGQDGDQNVGRVGDQPARSQLTGIAPSTSGVSSKTRFDGWAPVGSSR